MGETESAGDSAELQEDHVLTVGRQWERGTQRVDLQRSSKITYKLWVGNVRDRVSVFICSYPTRLRTICGRMMGGGVSGWFCSYPERSPTACGRAMGEMESAHASAAIELDHLHPVGQ